MISKHEWKIIAILSLLRDQDGVLMETLEAHFDKPVELRKAAAQLRRSGCITWDVVQNKLRLLERPVKVILGLEGAGPATEVTPLYSADERPLDAPLAQFLKSVGAPGADRSPPPPGRKIPGEINLSSPNVTFPERERLIVSSKRLNVPNVRGLREKIRAFVGAEDFAAHWDKGWLWQDLERLSCLEQTFNYVNAGAQAGEIKIRNRGKYLWYVHQKDWAKATAVTPAPVPV